MRARERDHAGAGDAALARRLACRGADETRQAGEIGVAAQHELEARLVGEHVLAEAGGQVGEPLHDLGIALLRRAVHARAGAHEVGVIALEHAQLLVAEAELVAPAMERIDAREQGAVHVDAAVVRRQQRRHLALDRLQRRRGLARGEVVEEAGDPVEQAARRGRARRRCCRRSAARSNRRWRRSPRDGRASRPRRPARIARPGPGRRAAGRTRPVQGCSKGLSVMVSVVISCA